MGNLITGVIEIFIGLYCASQQMITTHDGVVSALQGGTMITSHMTPQQLLLVLSLDAVKFNRFGWAVAWISQTVFITTVLPRTPVTRHGLFTIVVWIFAIGDMVTDLWYAIATNATLGGVFTVILSFGVGGIAGSVIYMIAMTAGSIFLFMDATHRLEEPIKALLRSQREQDSNQRERRNNQRDNKD